MAHFRAQRVEKRDQIADNTYMQRDPLSDLVTIGYMFCGLLLTGVLGILFFGV